MTIRTAAIAVIIACLYVTISSAAPVGIHIVPRDNVYYGDVVDIRGITGWTSTLAWWPSNINPAYDAPGQFANITSWERFEVTADMKPGMWYQWYGKNERAPVAVFYVVPRQRTAKDTVTVTPTVNWTPPPKAMTHPQPEPVADVLVAKGDPVRYEVGDCQVWFIGPGIQWLGNRTNGTFTMDTTGMKPGTYSLLMQYPDTNGMYEVYMRDDMTVDSLWKGVEGFWVKPLGSTVLKEKLAEMFADGQHFHGRVVEKEVVLEDQRVDISSITQTPQGSPVLAGFTNVAKGSPLTVVWNSDRPPGTVTHTNASGDDPGALRYWTAAVPVKVQDQPPGAHQVTVITPDGHEATVEFYISERFVPFAPPDITIRFFNNSPFVPTPTPLVIEKVVPVTVVQTVTIEVTPAYAVVMQAQNESAEIQRKVLEGRILRGVGVGIGLVLFGLVAYRGTRYGLTVVRRARMR